VRKKKFNEREDRFKNFSFKVEKKDFKMIWDCCCCCVVEMSEESKLLTYRPNKLPTSKPEAGTTLNLPFDKRLFIF